MCREKIKLQKYFLVVALLIPFWGALVVSILHFGLGCKPEETVEDSENQLSYISDAFRSYSVDKKRADKAVPIEEALLINSAAEKRAVIMDILNENPRDYVEFLQKASDNDDAEVVHYAVTAMVEISKENDATLQKLAAEYQENPRDVQMLSRYCDFLWECLSQNLMQGQVEVMNRTLFSKLVQEKMEMCLYLEDYARLALNEIKRKNFGLVQKTLSQMGRMWPHSEEYILLNIQYLALMHKGKEIQQFINEIYKKQIYLSQKAKEVLAFWVE
jgi:hypothetical protein